MQTSVEIPQQSKHKWTYATVRVHDGDRVLKPTHIGPDDIRFSEPPHLVSSEVEVILTVGDAGQRSRVIVLPHDANATVIPIQSVADSFSTL
jgi:hypothetical protein